MNLSPHFTLEELTRTSTGLPNMPDQAALVCLHNVCAEALEPIRLILGVPLRINSGFRSAAVNEAIGGAKSSQHMRGQAADFVPVGMPVETAMAKIADAVKAGSIIVDQLIVYPKGGFLHVSYVPTNARRELLRSAAAGGSGGPYTPWTRGGAW